MKSVNVSTRVVLEKNSYMCMRGYPGICLLVGKRKNIGNKLTFNVYSNVYKENS